MKRLQHYFWETNCLKDYKNTRNGMLGADYSSKFSPWLANGSISPRQIYDEVKKYEKCRHKNVSTYWLVFELIWRDFFRFVALKYGNDLFKAGGIARSNRRGQQNKAFLNAWIEGKTGYPFIDANMREIAATGFMSNRGRQNVASFLVRDLGLDWRLGAEYFESLLIDYDPCSNYGNWNYVAGIGNDPREDRYFNILSQGDRYDKKSRYIKHWLPELSPLPPELAREPFKATKAELAEFGVELGRDYPRPKVELRGIAGK